MYDSLLITVILYTEIAKKIKKRKAHVLEDIFCDLGGKKNKSLKRQIDSKQYHRNNNVICTDGKKLSLILYIDKKHRPNRSKKSPTQNGVKVKWELYLFDLAKDLKWIEADHHESFTEFKKKRLQLLRDLQEKIKSGTYKISFTGVDTGILFPIAGSSLHFSPTIPISHTTGIYESAAATADDNEILTLMTLNTFGVRTRNFYLQSQTDLRRLLETIKTDEICDLEASIAPRKVHTFSGLMQWVRSVAELSELLVAFYEQKGLRDAQKKLDKSQQRWFDVVADQFLVLAGANSSTKAAEYLKEQKIFIFVFGIGAAFKAGRGKQSGIHHKLQNHLVMKVIIYINGSVGL